MIFYAKSLGKIHSLLVPVHSARGEARTRCPLWKTFVTPVYLENVSRHSELAEDNNGFNPGGSDVDEESLERMLLCASC